MEIGKILALGLNIFTLLVYVYYGINKYRNEIILLLNNMKMILSTKGNQIVKLFINF